MLNAQLINFCSWAGGMAVDVCSEIASVVIISPRISFSYDLSSQQADPEDINASETESDFFFSIVSPSKCLHEPCLADEIFHNGKILPTQIKKKNSAIDVVATEPKKVRLKELLESEEEDKEERKSAQGMSFWNFRSTSMNFEYESGRAKEVIKSIRFLSRSQSTGSVPNWKQNRISRTSQKQNCQKAGSANLSNKSKVRFYRYGSASTTVSSGQKPPLSRTKSYGSSGVRISPLLNMPLPAGYFCHGNASLFKFSSLFCVGNEKNKKKKTLSSWFLSCVCSIVFECYRPFFLQKIDSCN